MVRTVTVVEALVLALWVGSLAGFAFIYAPIAFHALNDVDRFARVTATTLRALGALGAACGAVAVIAAAFRARDEGSRPLAVVRVALVVAMLGLTLYETRAIVPHMEAMATRFGAPLASLGRDDPRLRAYAAAHRASSLVYGSVLLLGAVAIALSALGVAEPRSLPRRRG